MYWHNGILRRYRSCQIPYWSLGSKVHFATFGRGAPQLKCSPTRFRFADTWCNLLGKNILLIAIPRKSTVFVEMDVVKADIPALLGLDMLDCESLLADTVANRSKKRSISHANGFNSPLDEWHATPHRSKCGHIYVDMDCSPSVMFKNNLHQQFFHPSAEKLFNLLKRARLEDTSSETLEILRDFSKCCDPCQQIHDVPTRFRVSFGANNVRFNEQILLDIVTIDSRPVLHIF